MILIENGEEKGFIISYKTPLFSSRTPKALRYFFNRNKTRMAIIFTICEQGALQGRCTTFYFPNLPVGSPEAEEETLTRPRKHTAQKDV